MLSLDPQDGVHLFILLPAAAGLAMLAGALIVWLLVRRWQTAPGMVVDAGPHQGNREVWLQYGLLGLLWWLALSAYLILDLVASVSLYPAFTAIYAVIWIVVGMLILHRRPRCEKLLVAILFVALLVSIRFIDWNSRKPFLRDFDRIEVGIPAPRADEIMTGYIRSTGAGAEVDEQGDVVSGAITYRHTTEAWGNADIGVVTVADGKVVEVDFLPD